ncbi:MAG TPA: hypothetical protein VF698_20660 [Thermoanaerobaculia bacterium]|jgi:tetratricopeptide (TPR) repeat protein
MTKVVSIGSRRRMPDPARVREFAATARKLQHEREVSGDVVERLLRTTPRPEWMSLLADPALRTTGAVDRLNREVMDQLERDPQHALALSELAVAVADALPANDYPAVVLAQVRAHAWKCRAQVLSYLNRYEDALAACESAEDVLSPHGTVAHDRAVVRLTRAIVLQHLKRFDDALPLISETRRVFFDHHDLKRCLDAGISEGNLFYRMHRFSEARAAWLSLLDIARGTNNLDQLARLHNNIGHSSVDVGDLESANIHLARAFALFTDLGKHVEALRCELSTAELLVRNAPIDVALARLDEVRHKLAAHGMTEEVGFCTLDAMLLLVGAQRYTEARALLRQVDASLAYREGMLAAIDYLTAAPSAGAFQYVQAFIRALRDDPTRPFIPQPA